MAVKQSRVPRKLTLSDRAIVIYRKHLKVLEDGEFDESLSFRQTVLDDFRSTLDTSEASLAGLFINCQKSVGVKVSKQFEITRTGVKTRASGGSTTSGTKSPAARKIQGVTAGTVDAGELTLVPKDGEKIAQSKPVGKVAPPAAALVATKDPTKLKSTAKTKAEKVHADLIALCKDEIEEAFQTLEELVDNVDQFGDAKTLRRFTRQMRAACKRIEDQLSTKAMLDKRQTNTILVGLQKGE